METKTRRKRPARDGYEDHEVRFDGRQLIWPWGEDTWGLDQIRAQVEWLRKWIETGTGLRVVVKPILALPGWWVTEAKAEAVRVVNHKVVPGVVEKWNPQPLSPEKIDLICRQLDRLCRDVED